MDDAVFRVTVPAKAMLWGEYGVLGGGPAVAISLPQFEFVCDFEVSERQNENVALFVESEFLANGSVSVLQSDLFNITAQSDRDIRFFAGACAPWKSLFQNHSVRMKVVRSFAPSLGFGSSSALIAALHRVFARMLWGTSKILDEKLFWQRVFDSLLRVQGGGSGYDVAVQSAALHFQDEEACQCVRAWQFSRCDDIPFLAEICIPDVSNFGFFLATHVYSDTAKAIQKSVGEKRFWDAHAEIARAFLENPCKDVLAGLMSRSRCIAREQGILPSANDGTPFAELCFVLDNWQIPWKHMGSGLGDCVWVAASSHALASAIHPVTCRPLLEEIVFQFSENGV